MHARRVLVGLSCEAKRIELHEPVEDLTRSCGMASDKTAGWPLWDKSQLSYASLLGPPHHQLRAGFNTLPRTHFTGIHRMAVVWPRMDRRALNAARAIQVSRFPASLTLP